MTTTSTRLTGRRALLASGAITAFLRKVMKPALANDAARHATAALAGTTDRNFRSRIPAIVAATKAATADKIAMDQAPDPRDLQVLLEQIADQSDAEDEAGANAANSTTERPDPRTFRSEPSNPGLESTRDRVNEAFDAEDLTTLLAAKLAPADLAKAKQLADDVHIDGDPSRVDEHKLQGLLSFLTQCGVSRDDLVKVVECLVPASESEPSEPAEDRRRRGRVLAHDALVRRDAAARSSFAKMFPRALPIRVLDAPTQVRRERIDPAAPAVQAFRKRFGHGRVV